VSPAVVISVTSVLSENPMCSVEYERQRHMTNGGWKTCLFSRRH